MAAKAQMEKALRAALRLIVDERREQFRSFTLPPHRSNPETYAAMSEDERQAIRRFDRAIRKIEEALR